MLETLRKATAGWIAKGLLALLILSFAIWGVADVFRGYGQGSLAKVGSTEITAEEFRRSYQLQSEAIRRQFQGRITPEQLRTFGLDQQILSRLIGSAAIDQHAAELQLALSDETLNAIMRRDPQFTSVDAAARQEGLSRQGYIVQRRQDEIRTQLTDALLGAAITPKTLIDLLYKHREEARTVSHFTIDPTKVVKIADPDEAKLVELYESAKRQFVTPETRKVAVALLTLEGVKAQITVTDAEARAAYDADKPRYVIAEKRKLQQIPFKDRASAETARAAIVAGQSFVDAAKAAGATETDIDLGARTRTDLIDPKIADAAFKLEKGKVSDVVEGKFTTVLLLATEIEPGRERPFEEVKADIISGISGQQAAALLQKLHDQIDDLRAGRKPLKDIATQLKLKFVEVAQLDKTGLGADAKPVIEGPAGPRIAQAAFEGKVGVEADTVDIPDGYAWVDVVAITPERQKELAEVRDDVKAVWIDLERRRQLSALAAKIADRAGKGEPFETLAAEVGGKIEVVKGFKRVGAQPTLTENAVQQAFILAKGKAGSAESKDGASRTIVRVDDIMLPGAIPPAEADKLQTEVARQAQNDVIVSYVAALQDRIGVTINQEVLRRATGADAQQ
jgi:peptidyl-prolyl cis-trans isomerase D